jgi:hypothetical protein
MPYALDATDNAQLTTDDTATFAFEEKADNGIILC